MTAQQMLDKAIDNGTLRIPEEYVDRARRRKGAVELCRYEIQDFDGTYAIVRQDYHDRKIRKQFMKIRSWYMIKCCGDSVIRCLLSRDDGRMSESRYHAGGRLADRQHTGRIIADVRAGGITAIREQRRADIAKYWDTAQERVADYIRDKCTIIKDTLVVQPQTISGRRQWKLIGMMETGFPENTISNELYSAVCKILKIKGGIEK